MDELYEVYALKYAERNSRTRSDSFLFDANPGAPHPMDYFLWVIRNERRTVVVDTGYDTAEGARRGRPILLDPAQCLTRFGVDPETVETVVVTHLHYDHAGSLDRFDKATFHLQAAEMAYVTGPCMCHDALRMPFTADHVCALIRKVYSGRVVFHEGAGLIAPGIEVHAIGGHTRGLQCVRVRTARGWLVLASDASHFYENYLFGKVFPIVENAQAMLDGFRRLPELASAGDLIVPGHDPLVRQVFPEIAADANGAAVHRLDVAPPMPPDQLLR
ncbi:N-acyl homoserine lactonase family protein [Algihabitans albus]|uniref:N-acyl homoserine lactonase family protein n=1 Tax=Algihabitans albus TaxID=2164067 RepID=UPI000E5CB070|nr:N-acyl homoserine lactonase family protein [Algihabitans albus]